MLRTVIDEKSCPRNYKMVVSGEIVLMEMEVDKKGIGMDAEKTVDPVPSTQITESKSENHLKRQAEV